MAGGTVQAIRDAGVVGAGGAGFPTHVKASGRAGLVIVNCAECEPLIRVDQQLAGIRAGKLLKGLSALMEAVGAARGVVALKAKYTYAIKKVSALITDPRVEIFTLADFYPAGDEQVLVREVTGRLVPEGGIPLDVGCVVCNVETVLNVSAAMEGQAVVDTWISVAGCVERPLTFPVPVGTPMREVLALAGVSNIPAPALLTGGPMMGKPVDRWDSPVTKTTKGLIVLPENHPLIIAGRINNEIQIRRSRSVCMYCARCSDVCPRRMLGHGIRPHRIMRSLSCSQGDTAVVMSSLLCSECGACEYACPMGLSPRRINAGLKKRLSAAGIRYRGDGSVPAPPEFWDFRKIPVKRLISKLGLSEYDRPAPIEEIAIKPHCVKIPLRQHLGAPAIPLVKPGDHVLRGQAIGDIPEGKPGARVHASIDGVVTELDDNHIVIEA